MPRIKQYSPTKFTWGFELEVGDVRRNLRIPSKYGKWEYSETDVVNICPPYQWIACDPLGKEPPVGGEINTHPTRSYKWQVDLIDELLKYLKKHGEATTNCISHTHVHVRVPGLTDDPNALKRLTKYIIANQQTCLHHCHAFDEAKLAGSKIAKTYLKWDCGRPMPVWMGDNIQTHTTSFADFIRLQCCGKDAKSMGRPFRYAINTYCLKHTGTIEFRLFRGSLDIDEISSCFRFVSQFIDAALNDGPTVDQILNAESFKFPPFRYSLGEADGWQKTKWPTSRGKKERQYIHIEGT